MALFFRQHQSTEQIQENESTNDSPISLFAAFLLIVFVALLLAFGLMMVQSTTVTRMGNELFYKQCMWAGIGTFLAVGTCLIGPRKITDWRLIISMVLGTWLLLLAARFVFPPINGAYRWVQISGLGNIQPSEIAKFAMILMMARWASDHIRSFNNIVTEFWQNIKNMFKSPNARSMSFLAPLFIFCVTLGLVFLGKDLGMSLLIIASVGAIIFVAGLRMRYVLLLMMMGGLGVAALCMDKSSFRYQRIVAFLDPEKAGDAGMQIFMSLLALGSGGFSGRGLGEGRLKTGYLPEDHTDCILSITGEELGFIGMTSLIVIFVFIILLCTIITVRASSRTQMFVGAGFTALLGIQMLMNIAVITSSIPAKGMPAPFISYGGSNLVTSLVAIGIIVSIAIDSTFPNFYDRFLGGIFSKNTSS